VLQKDTNARAQIKEKKGTNMNHKFNVEVCEKLVRIVPVDATSTHEAYDKVLNMYEKAELILTKKDYVETSIIPHPLDDLIECSWCGEDYTEAPEELVSTDLGMLCDKCIRAIRSRGETVTIKE